MQNFRTLLYKELRSFFVSPLAYVVMALVMVLNGVSFLFSVARMEGKVSQLSLLHLTFDSLWFWMVFVLLFPLITMRLIAEERKMGTLETLLTAPVESWTVILAKYAATLIFYTVLWTPSAFNFVLFEIVSGSAAAFNVGSFWGTYIILFLVGAFNIALGLFASSLTSNQLIAGVVAFALVTLHFFVGFIQGFAGNMPPEVLDRVTYFSTVEHLRFFSNGLIDTRPLIYYVTGSALMLTFTYYVLEYRRWRP